MIRFDTFIHLECDDEKFEHLYNEFRKARRAFIDYLNSEDFKQVKISGVEEQSDVLHIARNESCK